ncbi:unnamed protein product [Ectocarpus sp. 12 AP-2014]
MQPTPRSTPARGATDTEQKRRIANRIHCRETRERKRRAEALLKEEVEILSLYKALVEEGPDLFSCHRVEPDAPFSFVCENYFHQLQLAPEDAVGKPLASIVDPEDAPILAEALNEVLANKTTIGDSEPDSGKLVKLRVSCGSISCSASMSMVIGSQGLVVVTRLYDK